MKKRFANAVLVAALLAGMAPSCFSSDSPEMAERISVKPTRPGSGIKSGKVVAYGHLLQPPYLLEYRGEKLFVNNIQVDPSLLIEKFHPKPTPDEATKELSRKMGGIGTSAQARFAKGETAEQILESIQKEHGIGGNVVSNNAIHLILNHPAGPVHWTIPLSDTASSSSSMSADKKSPEERAREAKAKHLAWLKGSLKSGSGLIFLTEGGVAIAPAPETVIADVNRVMKSSATSQEKQEKLEREVFSWNKAVARDVLANYSESEWVQRKR